MKGIIERILAVPTQDARSLALKAKVLLWDTHEFADETPAFLEEIRALGTSQT